MNSDLALPKGKYSSVVPIEGDASSRQYFRLKTKAGKSLIAVQYDEPISDSSCPFVPMTEYFRKYRFPVPKIVDIQRENGIVILEDFGNTLLLDLVNAESELTIRPYYKKAIDRLVSLHGKPTDELPANHLANQTALDENKFFEELKHTHRYFLTELITSKMSSSESKACLEGFRLIARKAARQPWVLCHRDYHSRNILIRKKQLGIIDYQDARRGPYTYDLASLLRDPYADLPDSFVGKMQAYFNIKSKNRWNGRPFRDDFEIVALQRMLKAIGTFSEKAVHGNKRYLPYIRPALNSALKSFRYFRKDFHDLEALLRQHLHGTSLR